MQTSILILSVGFILWAGLHSLLASTSVKDWVRGLLGQSADRWYRLLYGFLSVITLLPLLVLLAILPDQTLYIVPAPWSWAMRVVQGFAVVGLLVAFLEAEPLDFLGLSQLQLSPQPQSDRLRIRGMHCWVRHPLYTMSIVLIWMTPTMTVNWLITCLFATVYFVIGSMHEETRLVDEFGEAYIDYQKKIPRLVPRPGHCYQPNSLS